MEGWPTHLRNPTVFVKQLINVIDGSGLILRRKFLIFISQVVRGRKNGFRTAKILVNNLKKKNET